ncbi:hypothetical protein QR680_017175 [Steinernema hermaphroditum]|uniref:Uncharacterized protein n=1 Tax=Steinernema hermaphroditum TaxID=289476 RepID=A0AA39LNN0_9BILA|nr:hypothetical protein QR680_017175 [Steinernema hermaphroditum]
MSHRRATIIAVLFLALTPSFDSSSPEHPNVTTRDFSTSFGCFNESSASEKTRYFLSAHAQKAAKPHLGTIQKLNNQINGELEYHLEYLKWKVVQDLMKDNPKFAIRGAVEFHFADVVQTFRRLIYIQSDVDEVRIKREIRRSLRGFLVHVFPSAFLCLPMGSCKSASASYIECLAKNAHAWCKPFFGADVEEIARKIAVLVIRYRKVQRSSEELHALLLQAPQNLDEEGFAEFAEAKFCETVVFCPALCIERARRCLRTVGVEWAKKLFELQVLAKNFGVGFSQIGNDILGIFFSSQTLRSTTVTEMAFKKCGPLRLAREEGFNEATVPRNRQKPASFEKGTIFLVEKVILESPLPPTSFVLADHQLPGAVEPSGGGRMPYGVGVEAEVLRRDGVYRTEAPRKWLRSAGGVSAKCNPKTAAFHSGIEAVASTTALTNPSRGQSHFPRPLPARPSEALTWGSPEAALRRASVFRSPNALRCNAAAFLGTTCSFLPSQPIHQRDIHLPCATYRRDLSKRVRLHLPLLSEGLASLRQIYSRPTMVAVGGRSFLSLLLLLHLLIAFCSAHIVEAEGLVKKDVAEAPSVDRHLTPDVSASSAERNNFEGSGAFEWSDDEDLAIEGSGSGAPPVIEDVTPSEPPPRIEIVPEIRVREESTTTRPSMPVIDVQATTTRSASALSLAAIAFCAAFRLLAVF